MQKHEGGGGRTAVRTYSFYTHPFKKNKHRCRNEGLLSDGLHCLPKGEGDALLLDDPLDSVVRTEGCWKLSTEVRQPNMIFKKESQSK